MTATATAPAPTRALRPPPAPIRNRSHEVVGRDERIPLLDGRLVRYVNLDNAASTPAFQGVLDTVQRFLPYASSVHRGSGYKSRISTAAFEDARARVGRFVGADPERDVVLFAKNTTEAINKLARSLALDNDAVVLTTLLEHHSNELPWRARPGLRTVCIRAHADGTLDEEDLDRRLREHAGHVALLAVTGASNVTGVLPPVHRLAEKVHAAGGRILVDAAQLAPHRAIDMRAHDDPGHLDFVAMSAHKLYAPFGSGALVGPRDAFTAWPDHCGGGTINLVTLDDVVWADLPDREEAGTPNVLGAIAFAAATSILEEIGFGRIAAHEADLTRHTLSRLARVPGVTVYGPTGPLAADPTRRLGVVSFAVEGLDHAYVAAVLGYEHGIGVRSGCFCAQPYIAHLLRLDAGERARWLDLARRNDHRATPGLVRISFGCYNDHADVDRAIDALEQATVGGRGTYHTARDGSYLPAGYYEPALFHLADPRCAARRPH